MSELRENLKRRWPWSILAGASCTQLLLLGGYWISYPASSHSPALIFSMVTAALTVLYLWQHRPSAIFRLKDPAQPQRIKSQMLDIGDFRTFWAQKKVRELNGRLEIAYLTNRNSGAEDLRMFLGAVAALDMGADSARKAAELAEGRSLESTEWKEVELL